MNLLLNELLGEINLKKDFVKKFNIWSKMQTKTKSFTHSYLCI